MKVRLVYIFIAIMLLLSYFTCTDSILNGIENSLRDKFLQSGEKPDTRIGIITIDEKSLEKLGQWPWSRKTHAELINKVASGKPAAIGIDIIFSEETKDKSQDEALIEAVKNAGNVVLPVYANFREVMKEKTLDIKSVTGPFPKLEEVAGTGHINVLPDEDDGVVRKHLNFFEDNGKIVSSFSWQIYTQYLKSTGKPQKDMKDVPKDWLGRSNIDFKGAPRKFERIPYYKVLNGEIPPDYFENRIVLIGTYAMGIGVANDYYPTPLDPKDPMYGIEIHANIIQNYMKDSFRKEVPIYVSLIILLAFGIASFLAFRKLGPIKSAVIMVGTVLLYAAYISTFVYQKGYILPILYPALAIVLTYFTVLAYRYLEELFERRRITGVFGRYVAPQVVNEILKGGEESLKLGGTRREITALFVDIRGFTPLSEKVEPEEVVGILNDYLNLCAQSIFDYGGMLDKFIGDATMAVFNAPMDLEDHAFKAVQTAWAMKEGSVALQKGLEEKYGRSVQFGIGINTGPAVVGNIGAKFRMDYTAIGDTVNTAARLESNSKPGQILMSEVTYELVKDRVVATSLGEIKVKGKTQGIPVYQLEGLK